MLSAMPFAQPHFDNPTVDKAGDALLSGVAEGTLLGGIEGELASGLEVIGNWRAAHAYPLNTFQMTLRIRTKQVDPQGIVAQRIKRLSSIEDKLGRYSWLKLSEMQDIAGCRVIVSSVQQVYELVEGYKRKYAAHRLDDQDDYISNPKSDGYRGYHLIYRYNDAEHSASNGLKVEMQFRSALQHCWATAVETVDIFLREGLKAHRGSVEWRRFFALMGSAIALRENCRPVPKTPRDEKELVAELRRYTGQLGVMARLKAFGDTLRVIGEANIRGIKYVILVLDPTAGTTQLYGYRASASEEASEAYTQLERYKTAGTDAVLVSVSDAANLRRAYPNYFLDTTVFLDAVRQAIS